MIVTNVYNTKGCDSIIDVMINIIQRVEEAKMYVKLSFLPKVNNTNFIPCFSIWRMKSKLLFRDSNAQLHDNYFFRLFGVV